MKKLLKFFGLIFGFVAANITLALAFWMTSVYRLKKLALSLKLAVGAAVAIGAAVLAFGGMLTHRKAQMEAKSR